MIKYLFIALFASTIPAANWLIGNVGMFCIPNGPCLIPVGFGLEAPSGVLMIGLALVLRDAVHETSGWKGALVAIVVGAVLSAFIAPPALVIASASAFLFSELSDMGVYAPLRKRALTAAVFASGAVGALVDSALFLWLAFGSIEYLAGQVVGKFWMSALAVPVLMILRRNRWPKPAKQEAML